MAMAMAASMKAWNLRRGAEQVSTPPDGNGPVLAVAS
jgi:hypothetical protein